LADHDNGNGNSQDNSGRGPRVFFLTGSATLARDPENPANEVLRFLANANTGQFSGVTRFFNHRRVQVRDLDNQLESRHRFEAPDTCGGGAPRMQIAVDLNNDGISDGNAQGSFGTGTFQTPACQNETWLYEDFTGADGITGLATGTNPSTGDPSRGEQNGGPNEEREWDLSQLTGPGELVLTGNPMLQTWSEFEAAAHAFTRHRVCQVSYIDDAGAPPEFAGGPTGESHADLISIFDETLQGWEDVAGRLRGNQDPCRFRGPADNDDDDDDDGGHHDDDDDNG
jgi:hypothetical protein